MTDILHLANPSDTERLLPMVAAFHAETGIDTSEEHRHAAITPLLDGSPHGAIWLVGPKMSPVGYIAVTFGWSIEFGGTDGFVDEFWIRQKVRGRGMGAEVLSQLTSALGKAGVRALHLEVDTGNPKAAHLYKRSGFRMRDGYHLMTWTAPGTMQR